ncbi:MAG: hypothetical protein KAQ69_10295 [Spirochaetales bacterium]|nr:hypothetical protein [Spirochaetales bacterium]
MENEENTGEPLFSKAEIIAFGSELQKLQRKAVLQAMVFCRPEVERIIMTNDQDKNTIEHTLDTLLEVAFDDNILLLLKKLCRYYYTIDPQATAEYIFCYRDMWDSDDVEEST